MVWHRRNIHGQSAIEYLATYGWVLLILAIALGVLYFLGVFNSNAYVAKASPYSCTVSRPYGPNSTAYMTLSGVCDNEIPEYVAKFNGQSSYIMIPTSPEFSTPTGTIAFWMYPTNDPTYSQDPVRQSAGDWWIEDYNINQGITLWTSRTGGGNNGYGSVPYSLDNWYFVTGTFSTTNQTLYINGEEYYSAESNSVSQAVGNILIGWGEGTSPSNPGFYFDGYITNVQFYNSTLTPDSVNALYREGIGGAPINLPNLVGWWQLNSNSNDTSGDLNNGASTNVIFTNTWYSTYS